MKTSSYSASTIDFKGRFDALRRRSFDIRARTAAERRQKLSKLRDALRANFAGVLGALAEDLAKPPFEAAMDAGTPLMDVDMAMEQVETWMAPSQPGLSALAAPGATAQVMYHPKGVVLIFGPWNFPFSLVLQPLIAAVAAGNTCLVKPSELAPATAAITAKIIREVFEEDEVAVITGGPDAAASLLELPFDHIFFTGSTAVGRRVMAAASTHLASVTLELGGKCPVIVDRATDLKLAANRTAWGKFLNSGQICLAPDHVWVRTEDAPRFAAHVIEYVRKSYYADGRFNQRDMARIVNAKHSQRLADLLSDAVKKGAVVAHGGTISSGYMEPTVVTHVPKDCGLMQEEIFGPILPILTYDDIKQLTAEMRPGASPLALYVFSSDQSFIDGVVLRTSSGGVTVNDVLSHAAEPNLPFGGIGASGLGAYHGLHGFKEMSHARSVYRQAANLTQEAAKYPPYGNRMPF
jgi:aldehyde dehydrogenase (NAD+)